MGRTGERRAAEERGAVMPANWVTMEHEDGVPWWEAPPPRRFHLHYAQTKGWHGFNEIWRCACGAMRFNGDRWVRERSPRVRGKKEAD